MKTLINAVALSIALTAPVVSFAQSSDHVTRAQVRNELVQLEKAGYRVGDGDQTSYPSQIHAAIARVSMQSGNGFGGVNSDSSAAGARTVAATNVRSVYAGH